MMRRFALLTVLLLAACGPSPQDVEATAQAGLAMTQTARPTNTPVPPTATATNTPRPTPTSPPTPAPLGVVVPYGALEITVLKSLERDTMHLGDISGRYYVYYYAPEGDAILDVAVLVHNTDPSKAVRVTWGDIYIIEDNGDEWYPYWAKAQSMEAANLVDPFSIGLSSEEINPSDQVEFVQNTYLRLVFLIRDKPGQELTFHIEGSPRIKFKME